MATPYDNYEFLKTLQENQDTILSLARNKTSRANVLILRPTGSRSSQEAFQNLQKEYNLLSQLEDIPGLARPQALVQEGADCLLELAYHRGQALEEFLTENRLGLEGFFTIALALGNLLDSLHGQGITFRNLHPGSILIDPETLDLMVFDFSLATAASETRGTDLSRIRDWGYMSPEQTGRVNRSVDYRSDYYSYGLILYRMAAGETAVGPLSLLETVHWHLARTAQAPGSGGRCPFQGGCPWMLSEIILKLISKNPNERYRSMVGILGDLGRCQSEWQKHEISRKFVLGLDDQNDQFRFPGKVFGREGETARLKQAYDEARKGQGQGLVLKGPAGVGKTSLVRELTPWIQQDQGFLLTGKCDQSKQEIPYHGIIVLLQDLTRQILERGERDFWGQSIRSRLKENHSIITELVPEFAAITGESESLADLSVKESEERFLYTLDSLLRILSEKRSLVIFLDDLQWVDPASLHLLDYLYRQLESTRHLIILAYRNEVTEVLSPCFRDYQNAGGGFLDSESVTLSPLGDLAVTELLEETLGSSVDDPAYLAPLLVQKSAGNPFFLLQLLNNLHQSGLLFYQREERAWAWKLEEIKDMGLSEDVSQLLVANMESLPRQALRTLQIASCLGFSFQTQDLQPFLEETGPLGSALKALVEAQYIQAESQDSLALSPDGGMAAGFRFQHDRIRQAAYEQIPPVERKSLHLRVGRALLDAPDQRRIIECASHYRQTLDLVEEASEKRRLAELFHRAGQQSFQSSAHDQAFLFYFQAQEFLDDLGEKGPLLNDNLFALAETSYHSHRVEDGESYSQRLLSRLEDQEERAAVPIMQMDAYLYLGNLALALERGRDALEALDYAFPMKPGNGQILMALLKVLPRAGKVNREALLKRQGSASRRVETILRLLGRFLVPAFMSGNMNLFVLSTLKAAEMALDEPNNLETAGTFGNFAILLSVLGKAQQAFTFGSLALELDERMPNLRNSPILHSAYTLFTLAWNRPWQEIALDSRRGIDISLRGGNLFHYAFYHCYATVFLQSPSIQENIRVAEKALGAIAAVRQDEAWLGTKLALQRWKVMAGQLSNPESLSDGAFHEEDYIQKWVSSKNSSGLATYHHYRMEALFHFGRDDKAWAILKDSREDAKSLAGSAYLADYAFYAFLIAARSHRRNKDRALAQKIMKAEAKRIRTWARGCPQNFEARRLLEEAEVAFCQGKQTRAARYYSLALERVADSPSLRDRALFHECAAQFQKSQGDRILGGYLLKDALQLYRSWGAEGIVTYLVQKYPSLAFHRDLVPGQTQGGCDDSESLFKLSAAVLQERDMSRLQALAMDVALENAGAEQGWLLSHQGGRFAILARGTAQRGAEVLEEGLPLEADGLPAGILGLALEEERGLLIGNAQEDPVFASEVRRSGRKIRSVLCLPFRAPGSGSFNFWYLENNLLENAFGPERLEGLRILSGQVAISLENARIYRTLQESNRDLEMKVEERTRELEDRNRQFLSSVEYAGVLQRSLLPRQFPQEIAQHFLLWKPRDPVGGDLLWFHEGKDERLLALVDCTGHGVPGALITLVVHSLLNELVRSLGTGNLPAFLRELNSRFRTALGQDRQGTESNDGFDIALLAWNAQGREFRFCGAQIDLYHQDGKEVSLVRGERLSLGYPETPEDFDLPVHSIKTQPGNRLILTTDGYLSQVGGEQRISFGRKRFQELLEESSALTLEEQGQELERALREYRDPYPQFDDVLVAGVEL